MNYTLKNTIATILAIFFVMVTGTTNSYSISKSGNKTNRDYKITVKSRDIYIPYHLYGLEKTLKSDKQITDIKINKRAGNVKFIYSSIEEIKEEDIIKIFSTFSLTPNSIKIKIKLIK